MLDKVFRFLVVVILFCVEFIFLRRKIPVEEDIEDIVEEPDEVIDDRPDAEITDFASWKKDHPQNVRKVRMRRMNG